MADFQKLLDKLEDQASDRDAATAKVKCPKKRKPALFVMVLRFGDNEPLSGIEVDVSKPTKGTKRTLSDGIAKFDPAKVGTHNVKALLNKSQQKTYVTPPTSQATVAPEKTRTHLILIHQMPSLQVVLLRADDRSPVEGAKIQLSGPESLDGQTAPRSGMATFNQLQPGQYEVKVSLGQQLAQKLRTPDPRRKNVRTEQQNLLEILVETRGKVDPTLKVDDAKVVLVKRAYMDEAKYKVKPHRLPVRLGTTARFDGTGRLLCNISGKVKAFSGQAGGEAVAFPIPVSAAQLNQVHENPDAPYTLYLEGIEPSGAVKDVKLTLELQGGTAILGDPVHDQLTCVRLKLDICKWRVDEHTDPVPIPDADKISKGRYVHEQNDELEHERALLIVHKAEPAAYTGSLRLQVWDREWEAAGDRIELFDVEKPANGQAARPNPCDLPNTAIPNAGQKLWVQGKTSSDDMFDTPIRLGLADVPDDGLALIEGDRVTVTVLKTALDLCQSKTTPDDDPLPLSDEDKVKKGRYVHQQDTGFHHGRALVRVKKVSPVGFAGKLTLTVWDATAKSSADPRLELFEQEIAANGQSAKANPYEFDHSTVPEKGLKFWAQGKAGKVSGALRDTEIQLSVKDHIKICDRAALTVVRFKNLKADIPSTPANINRGGNFPVTRHTLVIGQNNPAAKDFDEDFAINEPLPLIEGSIKDSDKIKLSVEIEPATAKPVVSWSVQRDERAGNGDHEDIVDLDGNQDDPGLVADAGDRLKATLMADAVGSFHIRPYIDCNGNDQFDHNDGTGKRIDREPFIIMNLVLIRVQGFNNLSVANSAAGSPTIVQDGTGKPERVTTGDFAMTGNDAVYMKATVRVIGGGQNGKLGLDMLFAGWVNNELNCPTSPGPNTWGEDATHSFQRPPRPLNPLVPQVPPREKRTRCYWALANLEITGPVLDSGGYGNAGLSEAARGKGGNTATSTSGGNDCVVTKTDDVSGIGQNWLVENVDSPGGGVLQQHPTDALATLRNFKFNLDFRCDLVFWTNRQKVSDATDAPACRLYSSVSTNTWNIRLESTFDGAFVETVVTPKTVTFTEDPDATRRATPVAGSGLETRCPGGLFCGKYDQPF